MSTLDVIALVVTVVGLACFCVVFTILYISFAHSSVKETEGGERDIDLIDKALKERNPKNAKRKKRSIIAGKVFYVAFLCIIIPLFGIALIDKIEGNQFMVGNSSLMVCASGSMSEKNAANDYLVSENLNNQFQTYDILVLNKVSDESQLKQYDVISYRNDKGINIIHRIIGVNNDNGVISFTTRGDANNASDIYHPVFKDIIGKYSGKKANGIGIVVLFLQSYPGIITIVAVIYCLSMIDHYSSKIEEAQQRRTGILLSALDLKDPDAGKITAEGSYEETIYYKGNAYKFDGSGFIEKRVEEKGKQKETDSSSFVKVVKDQKGKTETTSQVIPSTQSKADEREKGK
jgi:signal peptidase I